MDLPTLLPRVENRLRAKDWDKSETEARQIMKHVAQRMESSPAELPGVPVPGQRDGSNFSPQLYDSVQIRQLLQPPEAHGYSGTTPDWPKVGDVGVLIECLTDVSGVPCRCLVECVAPDGRTKWLGEFLVEELEPVDPTVAAQAEPE